MGYSTYFYGSFQLTSPVSEVDENYLAYLMDQDRNKDPYQPDSWCQWELVKNKDGFYHLRHDGGEKFYFYIEWLEYLIKNYFNRYSIKLNGKVFWSGGDADDTGLIWIKDNELKAKSFKDLIKDLSWDSM